MEDQKDEKQQIYRGTDRLCLKTGRDRNTDKRGDTQDRNNRADLLQVEEKIWWYDAQ